MNYCIVNADGIIENTIVCESDEVAEQFGAVASYDGAAIGEAYDPPPPEPEPPTTDERVEKLESENKLLREQVKMQSQQQTFLEDCLLEIGDVVYA